MATAKGAEYDKIQGLDLGADYYLTKPFGVMELVSCVKAVLRRCQTGAGARMLRSRGHLTWISDEHTVTVGGQRVALTYKEFELLRLFLTHPGMAFTRDQLMERDLGHGLLRRDPHRGYAHPHPAAEAGQLRQH